MKKLRNKLALGLFAFIFTLAVVSANGLMIQTPSTSTVTINKTFNQDAYVNLTIKNTDAFDFFNISFEDNPYIQIIKIPRLSPGENKTVEARIISDEEVINTNLRIKGTYEANMGLLNETHNIHITNTGFDTCLQPILKGDKIKWINDRSYSVTIRNSKNLEDIITIPAGDYYELPLEEPQSFSFYGIYSGFIFTQTCEVVVLDNSGQVNNPEYDAILNFNLNLNYPSTTIQTSVPVTNYEIGFLGSDSGILTIKNNGTEIARNIKLEGKWTKFSTNNFDILPGITKAVSYTISPIGYITMTNETNQTYQLNFSIKGNFQEYNSSFNLTVPYSSIGNVNGGGLSYEDIIALFQFCEDNPDYVGCPNDMPIYIYTNKSNNEFNVSLTEEQFKDLVMKNLNFFEDYSKDKTEDREKADDLNQSIINLTQTIGSTVGNIEERDKTFEEFSNSVAFQGWMTLFIFIVFAGVIILPKMKKKKELQRQRRTY